MLKFSLLFVLFLNWSHISAYERKLSTYVNPGCSLPTNSSHSCDDFLMVHIKSEGVHDTLHHIWDFTAHPSLMLVLTDKDSSLQVDWSAYLAANHSSQQHSIAFTNQPIYAISVVVTAIIEFNDTGDLGVLDVNNESADYAKLISIDQIKWKTVQPMTNDTNTVLLAVEGHLTNQLTDSNVTAPLQISMGAFGGEERATDLPHMLHSANMSQMDITLDHLPGSYERSRFGLSLLVVTSDRSNRTLKYDDKQSVDDEHAPGVFKMVELLSAGARQDKFELLDDASTSASPSNLSTIQYGGYLQWRPIAYTTPTRDDSQATRCKHYGISAVAGPTLSQSQLANMLPYKLFGNDSGVLYQTTNVTFGQPEDGYYNKTRFASWTFVVGIGSPAQETFSSFVMQMVLLGIGLPLVLVIIGIICISIRRLIQNKDDFFLSQ